MSKFEFVVKTYSYDDTGYYIGVSNELTVTVIAENTEQARNKALEMRKTDKMGSCDDRWGAKVISAKEIYEPIES